MQETEPRNINPDIVQSSEVIASMTPVEQALQRRVEFLNAAQRDGAHLKVPVRELFVVVLLTRGTFTSADLARYYKLERERIRQLHNEGMESLWHNTKEETQEKFPLKSILGARKPRSVHVRERYSEAHGGTSRAVIEAIEKGAKTREEIKQATQLSMSQINRAINRLRGWGIDVPRERLSFKDLKKRLEEAKDDDTKTQEVLDNIPPGVLRGYLVNHRGDTFTTLGPILRSAGFHINNRYYKRENIDGLIKNAGIPLVLIPGGVGTSHVVLKIAEQRIIDLLNREPRLQRFKK